ncbi:glycosyltransferase [Pseudoalteromonas gelatinilytica]|uniref:Glycosyl transferase n=1 Tax=Pseudoalteromonas gelatinilytica TaxID=1703256 RepID=A0ABQ1TPL3_9GAMM|nr:glycosyltransferase [Pseudoalteromonas profundi]GGF00334.1 glycosyl transferase [Pseudoalteromonas profundi]
MENTCYLIPYYNALDELHVSLRSLVESIDVVIVDDGSDIPLHTVLDVSLYNFDITIITAPRNGGIERALNIGLEHAYGKYEYVARLDCGDLSLPNRIKKQLKFLSENSEYVLVGSWARFVDERYELLFINELPSENESIKKKMFLNNMFMHPSVLMRLSVVQEVDGYPENRKAAEDYALFFKLMKRGKVANLPEALIDYVVAEGSISSQKRTLQVLNRLKVIIDNKSLNFFCVYGVIRTLIILAIPRKATTYLRKLIKVY